MWGTPNEQRERGIVNKVITVGGIDPSSKRLALTESRAHQKEKAFIHHIILPGNSPEENALPAFNFIAEWGMHVIERDGQAPTLFVEAPVMGGSKSGGFRPGPTIEQAFITGVIFAAASQIGSKIYRVNNSSWKAEILGNGNIAKENIAAVMQEVWPEFMARVPTVHAKQHNGKIPNDSPDQDIVDSGAINLFGWKQVEQKERFRKVKIKRKKK